VQRRANLLVYGVRNDPVAMLTQLGERRGSASTPDEALPAALRTVAEVLGLHYAAVDVAGARIASYGTSGVGTFERVPLPFASEVI
jgi:hypothetical protein